MKITKRQLKRIIKEEKAKLLSESGVRTAERSLGLHANVSDVDNLTDSLMNIIQAVELGVVAEEGLEDDEAEELASNAALLAVAQAMQAAGLFAEYQALYKMIERG